MDTDTYKRLKNHANEQIDRIRILINDLEITAIESPAEATGYSILKDKTNEALATLTDRKRTVTMCLENAKSARLQMSH